MNEILDINAIRILSADMIQKANSGHPGICLGAAPMAYELWGHHMNHNPADPDWMNRDRFILSAGHGSAMLYSLLHLYGYGNLSVEDLKQFRQLGSVTPGHPEYGMTVGVEASTGPLGAGLGMAAGMALAEKNLAARYNRPGYPVFDHYTYAICGDGCLMEGISEEVMSFAGTNKLGKLIFLYDSNKITIEGDTDATFTEDVLMRAKACGFQTLEVMDGTDTAAIGRAIEEAKADTEHPSLIKINTTIGYGCPAKAGKANSHGEPLGVDNLKATREALNWPCEENFLVPEEVYADYKELAEPVKEKEAAWQAMYKEYCEKYPELAAELQPSDIAEKLLNSEEFWVKSGKDMATRAVSGNVLNEVKDYMPQLIGGAADLGPSTKSEMKGLPWFSAECPEGRNIHFGIREMGMHAIANGILLHGGLRPYISTFFVFCDYMKPMMRLASLMKIPMISILTHDSIGVGEDGPTHLPVEQLSMLRALPNMHVFRPADETEAKAAWLSALMSRETPTALVLSRQNLPALEETSREAFKGGYVIYKEQREEIDVLIYATGSEVSLAIEVAKRLEATGTSVRVVSMPCIDIFIEQSKEYRESVAPLAVTKRVVMEAGHSMPWGRLVGFDGCYICVDDFGVSAPAAKLFEKFGFTADQAEAKIRAHFSL